MAAYIAYIPPARSHAKRAKARREAFRAMLSTAPLHTPRSRKIDAEMAALAARAILTGFPVKG